MINKENFKKLKKEIEQYTEKREDLIKKSRDVISLSKQIIYNVHRGDLKQAEKFVKDIKKIVSDLRKVVEKEPSLEMGSYKVAVQEYVEAACYYEFLKSKKLLTDEDLDVNAEQYLSGICDLTGELVRYAYNIGIKGDVGKAEEIRQFIEEVYNELMLFAFRSGELRKKFDQIKYNLKNINQLVFDLKVKK
jgi:predicted translin family RNA/ssDNA-binding protein